MILHTLTVTLCLLLVWGAAGLAPAGAHGLRRKLFLLGMVLPLLLPAVRGLLDYAGMMWVAPLQLPDASSPSAMAGATGDSRTAHALMLVWGAGTALFLARSVWQMRMLHRLVRGSRPLSGETHRVVTKLLASRGRGCTEVRLTPHAGTAFVCLRGWRAVILLPEEAVGWDLRVLRAVLTHELEHVKRGDAWWRLAGSLVTALWWWHPLVHLTLRQWTEACEHLCDDAVLRSGVRPQRYAQTLLRLAMRPATPADPLPAMALVGRPGTRLRRRVASILSFTAGGHASSSWLTWSAVTVVALLLLLAALIRFEKTPSGDASSLREEAALRLEANPFPADQ